MPKTSVQRKSISEVLQTERPLVDKTRFIKILLDRPEQALLITRPQGFGKTCFLKTLKTFLNPPDPDKSNHQRALFSHSAILEEETFCERYMGRVPVIAFSFEDVHGLTFEEAHRSFSALFRNEIDQLDFLNQSPHLSDHDKARLNEWLNINDSEGTAERLDLRSALKLLIEVVAKHFAHPVVVLIDDYDAPLRLAAKYGYYDEMAGLLESVFGQAFKTDLTENHQSTPLLKAILTGTLPWHSHSAFTGFNNLVVNSVLSQDHSLGDLFGFTECESHALFETLDSTDSFNVFAEQCGRHVIAQKEVYANTDVLNFLSHKLNASASTSDHTRNLWDRREIRFAIQILFGSQTSDNREILEKLVNGESVDLTINPNLTYQRLIDDKSTDLWTWLIHTGYLTVVEQSKNSYTVRAKILNTLVRDVFVRQIQENFSTANGSFVSSGRKFIAAAINNNLDDMTDAIMEAFDGFIPIKSIKERETLSYLYCEAIKTWLISAVSNHYDIRPQECVDQNKNTLWLSVEEDESTTHLVMAVTNCTDSIEMYKKAECALDVLKGALDKNPTMGFLTEKHHLFSIAFTRNDCAVVNESA